MKILFRVLTSLVMMLAILLLASCTGAPGCPQAGFGSSTACSSGGSGTFGGGGGSGGGGGGGGGGATPAAFAYAVDQNGGTSGTGANGTIDGFDLSTSAATFVGISNFTAPQILAGNPGTAMVVARKQFVYALFDAANGVYGWTISSNGGGLTAMTGSPFAIEPNLPISPYNQYNVTTDPAGNYLFIAETNADAILVYTIGSSGALTLAQTVSTTIPPGNMTTDGLGRYLYVCENFTSHTGGEIAAYAIGSGGTLTTIQGSPFTFTPGMWQLQGDPTGNYLIGTSGNTLLLSGTDDNHLYVFSVSSNGSNAGALTAASSAITTFSPFNIAVSPASSDEEFVYSFSINDVGTAYNPIEGFQLSTTTSGTTTAGTLTALTNSPFISLPDPDAIGAWGQFDQSGQNLVVYSNTAGLIDGLSASGGLVALTPLSVDSSGNLTQPITTPVPLVTPGYWVVTDP
jgi:6-phosphogluconolactonase (cycloisomerase 2 family)